MDDRSLSQISLGDLLAAGGLPLPEGLDPDAPVAGLTDDSRAVAPGWIFVAVPGTKIDARLFIPQAFRAGAALVVSEGLTGEQPGPCIESPDIRRTLSLMAHAFHGNPTRRMLAVGVTGTNGKTTTTYLLEGVMRAAGHRPGVIGTIEGRFEEQIWPAPTTTPGPVALAEMTAEMAAAGADALAMEISSHAIEQHRADGVAFDAGIFTNLSQDHLDYHGTMEAYGEVKRRLFTELLAAQPGSRAVTNLDEPLGIKIGETFSGPVVTYGHRPGANVRIVDARANAEGTEIDLMVLGEEWQVMTPLIGPGNVMNVTAAIAWAQSMGWDRETIQQGVSACSRVPGRLERIDGGQPFFVLVDYSHTPDSLQGALRQCRVLAAPTGGRVLVVFGCGGDRDPIKRPIMGEIAGTGADLVWLTSDNPRTEDPQSIIDDALVGLKRSQINGDKRFVEIDRRRAIEQALAAATAGDVVLIAGKGHETYQEIGTERFPFDDSQIAREWLRTRPW